MQIFAWGPKFLMEINPRWGPNKFLKFDGCLCFAHLATAAEIWGPKFLLEIAPSWGPISYSNDFLTYVGGVCLIKNNVKRVV